MFKMMMLIVTAVVMLLGGVIDSPLESVNFLNDLKSILKTRFTPTSVAECLDPEGEC